MRFGFLFYLFFTFVTFTFAQQTGSFQESVSFDESDYSETRTLYYYIPEDYNSNQKYKLVVGFRGGPHINAGQFRDQLSFLADSIGAIILCPENSDHFWNEEPKTRQLFRYSLEHLMSTYSIDEDFIYLTGLSYGGRHAVMVSMNAEIDAVPPLRGVIPFAAGSDSQLVPNYENTDLIPPACICIGLNDNANFQNVSNTLHNDLQTNGGTSILNEIPNVGHTVAFANYPTEMMECINFIDNQYESTSTFEKSINIDIYPNPASQTLHISGLSSHEWKLKVSSVSGKPIRNVHWSGNEIQLPQLPAGLYYFTFNKEKEVILKSILIQN